MPRLQPLRRHPERTFRAFLRANRFFLLGIALLLTVQLGVLMTNPQGDMLLLLNKMRQPWADTFFRIGTKLGEPLAYGLLLIPVAAFRWRTAIFMIVTGATVAIAAGILKVLFGQARPLKYFGDLDWTIVETLNRFPEEYENWGLSSFPSGHTASAFALYSFLCFNVKRPKVVISILCFLLAFEVGLSRMYLLYHFLRDVTAGALLGVLVAVLTYLLQWSVWPEKEGLNRGWWHWLYPGTPLAGKVPPP
ncbi:MAG: phosphatase PAP2 family protein [Bacteroidota bacterium]